MVSPYLQLFLLHLEGDTDTSKAPVPSSPRSHPQDRWLVGGLPLYTTLFSLEQQSPLTELKVLCPVPLHYSNNLEHAATLMSKTASMRPLSLPMWHWGLSMQWFTCYSPILPCSLLPCGLCCLIVLTQGIRAEVHRNIKKLLGISCDTQTTFIAWSWEFIYLIVIPEWI